MTKKGKLPPPPDAPVESVEVSEPPKPVPREAGELVVFGLIRSDRKVNEVLPTFHVYRAVVSPDTYRIVEQDTTKQSFLLFEAQHLLEAGLTEEFDRLTDTKRGPK